ncbi:glutamine-hydrolyzing carbamoyl-phosphate synthase small subunit [Enterobacteriaceae endosymbiont of Plateumaris consimilis]|uniref:glutamine-hydrolyzing carbamoyl-phosphate synthase small subunit n=1 Tax=Enterobacteriaceae endosymbiont of Plateumaris consimilis TaxID=2675794 RepID=UPI001448F88D|nr:glutamine-hydrolyzing carbamoyl-phosphate synthase small subunit [Enterobacteriaceae endosymbiont of Plateumaris consimilis]QJC28862.1 glutamine-hydrolyzing carbamoyl-phosphate synthase small subunit [Enterobacteriaceae endosymbiont of Plateumaris consimilis]
MNNKALLIMEDGTKFFGKSIGVNGIVIGEVVFNTSMTGYQEILTDPSYYKQILVFTYPHIGNIGVNKEDEESSKIYLKGLIIHNLSIISSNYRSQNTLDVYLKKKNVVAISDIDTRQLTRLLRNKKINIGCIITNIENVDFQYIMNKMKHFSNLQELNLVKEITTNNNYSWIKGNTNYQTIKKNIKKKSLLPMNIIAYDFGIKKNILNILVDRGCHVTVISAYTSFKKIINLNPDGIFLSNGPGNPESCFYAISSVKQLLKINIPIFGICLGHQILALASGAKTKKMVLGHHGSNHPVKNLKTNKIFITTQNHGFTVDTNNLPINLKITHKSLFDNTIQGIHRIDKPAFGFQGHPEASPGPHDISILFDYFIELIQQYCLEKYKRL